jgi:peptidoglycan/LPS O-acetylase OafA/YrhL
MIASISGEYKRFIDGLRAVAVLSVIFYHAGIGFPGGYVGVDIFFVISGYLITGLILKDIRNKTFSLQNFWERRILRIMPALIVVIIISFVCGFFILLPNDFREFGNAIAQSTLIANIYCLRHADYFAQISELKPLLHTWSLAVEEQFYMLFPFLILLVKKYNFRLRLSLSVCIISSLTLSILWTKYYPLANFYLLPPRAWELLLGGIIAIPIKLPNNRFLLNCTSSLGAAMVAASIFLYNKSTPFPGTAALLPCVGTALIILPNSLNQTLVGKALSFTPLVYIGLISYSLYLWHWPILVYAKYLTPGDLSFKLRIMLIILSIFAAYISWRFIEKPFRKRKILKSRSGILLFAILAISVLIIVGFSIYKSQGIESRFPLKSIQYSRGSIDHSERIETTLNEAEKGSFIKLGSRNPQAQVFLFLWGDSHAMSITGIVDQMCKERNRKCLAATHSGAAPVINFDSHKSTNLTKEELLKYNQSVLRYIKNNKIPNILIAARWDIYSEDIKSLRSALLQTIDVLKSAGVNVYILKEVPRPGFDVPRALALSELFNSRSPHKIQFSWKPYLDDQNKQTDIFNNQLNEKVSILDPQDIFIKDRSNWVLSDGEHPFYSDNNHLSAAGAMKLRPLLYQIFSIDK